MNRQQRRAQKAKAKKIKFSVFDHSSVNFKFTTNTGHRHASCYASSTDGCSSKISKEHYVSENILELFESISVKGWPGISEEKKLPASALVVNSLCTQHNSDLSPLDTHAGLFFKAAANFGTDNPTKHLFSGNALEAWMIKLLFGLVSTGKINSADKKANVDFSSLPPELMQTLFYSQPLPSGWGTYLKVKTGDELHFGKHLQIQTLFLAESIKGLRINFAGFHLWFLFCQPEEGFNMNHPDNQNLLYRPNKFDKSPYPQEIAFDWNQPLTPTSQQGSGSAKPN